MKDWPFQLAFFTLLFSNLVTHTLAYTNSSTLVFAVSFTTTIVVISYFNTSLKDPGFVPKQTFYIFQDKPVPVKIQSVTFYALACASCNFPKPPGTSHCKTCDRCVLYLDHHCSWLGTCIGARNYLNYIVFLLVNIVNAGISLTLDVMLIVESQNFHFSITSCVISIVGVCFSGYLMIYHIKLLLSDKTTRDDLKKRMRPIERIDVTGAKNDIQQYVATKHPGMNLKVKKGAVFRMLFGARQKRIKNDIGMIEQIWIQTLILSGWINDCEVKELN